MTWGTGAWGVSPWGGVGASFYIANAYPLGTRRVRVFLSAEARARSSVSTGDALNPASWRIQRLDTGAYLPVIQVDQINGTTFDVVTLQPFGSHLITHKVYADDTLQSSTGDTIVAPKVYSFAGLLAERKQTPQAAIVARGNTVEDIANPPVGDDLSGHPILLESGDYMHDFGDDLAKKLILRRATTPKGAFPGMPEYGFALKPKGFYRPVDLNAERVNAERQVREEPEVQDASVDVSMDTSGVVIIDIKAKTRSGDVINVQVSNDPGGG